MCEHCEDLPEEVKKLREPYEGIKGCQNIWKPVGEKYEDLSGQVFGRLTAIEAVGRDRYGSVLWLCKCECLNKIIVIANNLKRKTRSCGCLRKEMLSKMMFKDLTGQIFGRLTVLREAGRDKFGKVLWEVKCSCGTIFNVSTERLTSKQTRSCGCLKREQTIERCTKPMVGKTFGRLTVIEEAYRKKGKGVYYKCSCSCGNTAIIQGSMLRSGNSRSCGCLTREASLRFNDLSGQKFGKLTVLNREENSPSGSIRYRCSCECGGEVIVLADSLKSGETISCGCVNSKGEYLVSKILQENGITFEKQKSYSDLRNGTHGILRFDFYVPDGNYLIEYDGIQHFKPGCGWDTKEHFEKVKRNDDIKNEYCRKNNIILIRIPYTHINEMCIEDMKPETSKFIIN